MKTIFEYFGQSDTKLPSNAEATVPSQSDNSVAPMLTSPPDDPFMRSPQKDERPVPEPLSTKRERMESSNSRLNGRISRLVRSAPQPPRYKHNVYNKAHFLSFKTPPNSPVSRDSFADGRSLYSMENECAALPVKSPRYNLASQATYFEQCFAVEKKLGEGSFGEVFQVKSLEDGRHYAVKRALEAFRSHSDRAIKLREVEKHEELSPHPNLVRFYKAWEERGKLYIQTELCIQSLSDYCTRVHVLQGHEVWNIFYDMLNATDYIHSRSLIHLDIKPENIFLTLDKVCKLGDFGLIFDLKHDHKNTSEEGDSKYLAPEVLNKPPTQAADVFSLGITILEVATDLDLPSSGDGWNALRDRRIPQRFLDMMDPTMRRLVVRMLDPDPRARPTTRELISDPSINWDYKRRGTYMFFHQASSTVSHHLEWLFLWLVALLHVLALPFTMLADLISSRREAMVYNQHTPERSVRTPAVQAYSGTRTPIDYDSFSDEGTHGQRNSPLPVSPTIPQDHHRMAARSIVDQFYSADVSPRLRPSNSPFKNDVEPASNGRGIAPGTSTHKMTTRSSMNKRSPAIKGSIFDEPRQEHDDPYASMERQDAMAWKARSLPRLPPPRLCFDSDSSSGEENNQQLMTPPHNGVISQSRLSGLRRSALRTLGTPRHPKLDFSILDKIAEKSKEDDSSKENVSGRRRRRNPAAGDS